MALRAIGFDLWETLIADPPGRGHARQERRVGEVERGLRAGGWPAPPEAIADAFQATVDSLVQVHSENRDVDAQERVALFHRHLDPTLRPERDLPADARAAIAEAIWDSAIRTPPELLAGALDTLAALRARGLRLALVSNTGLSPGAAIRRLLERLGLAGFFTAQIYSDEVGAWKPHARMFDEAVFALGVTPDDVAFVGDSPEADILGAQAFGLAATVLVGAARVDGLRPTLTAAQCGRLGARLH